MCQDILNCSAGLCSLQRSDPEHASPLVPAATAAAAAAAAAASPGSASDEAMVSPDKNPTSIAGAGVLHCIRS